MSVVHSDKFHGIIKTELSESRITRELYQILPGVLDNKQLNRKRAEFLKCVGLEINRVVRTKIWSHTNDKSFSYSNT